MADEVYEGSASPEPSTGSSETSGGHDHGALEEQIHSVAGRLEAKYAELEQKLTALAAEWSGKAEAITKNAEKKVAELRAQINRLTTALQAKAAAGKKPAAKAAAKPKAAKKGKS